MFQLLKIMFIGNLRFLTYFAPMVSGSQRASDMGLTKAELTKFGRIAYFYHRISQAATFSLVTWLIMFTLSCSVVAYKSDPETSILMLIIGFLLINAQFLISGLFGFRWVMLYLLTTFYPRIRFRNMNSTLTLFQHKRALPVMKSVLKAFVKQFDEMCVFVNTFNYLAKYILFLFYLTGTPCLCLLFYLSVYGDVNFVVRMIALMVLFNGVSVILTINYQTARIAVDAHNSYSILNSILVRNPRMAISTRIKANLLLHSFYFINLIDKSCFLGANSNREIGRATHCSLLL